MTIQTRIEIILKGLTLEEKISLLAGQSLWETVSIPEKGIPKIKTSDGPNGARGADFEGGTKAACFPAACCVASTFDLNAAYRIGEALAEETRTKGARCLLAPTTCIHRHPLGGRNFESFSEDPFLSGKLASQVIQGLQSKGIAATIKHFVANEQETDRMTVDELISERALREIYLRPFEIAIKEAEPWAIMTSYNSVNGKHADMNTFLLQTVLRGEWGFEGLVMSDWDGTSSVVESINAGLDLEMPGPVSKRLVEDVVNAVQQGKVMESTIDERARSVLKFLDRLGAFEDPIIPPEQAVDKPEHRALIREVGARGIVLLKNQGPILPLTLDKIEGKKIAVLGLSKTALAYGGGSASLNAHYKVSPWDALVHAVGGSAVLTYSIGANTDRVIPALKDDKSIGRLTGLDKKSGWTMLMYEQNGKEPVHINHGQVASSIFPILREEGFGKTVELVADFIPVETGSHYMGASGFGPAQIFINDTLVYEQKSNCSDTMGFLFSALSETEFTYEFTAGTCYRIRVRTTPRKHVRELEMMKNRPGVRFGLQLASRHDCDLLSDAIALAKDADYALVFTGHDSQWETEGLDQHSFYLPKNGSQDALVSAVASVNKNVVVINSTGVAVAMPWLDDVAAVVQSWFPGQECGNSIVDVLTGKVNPEGRLPVSFPKRLEDAPAYGNFPGEYTNGQRTVNYAEDVFVGYRHYDRTGTDKLNFPFGHGLSYTSFETSQMQVTKQSTDAYSVTVDVTNVGDVAGATVVQAYVGKKEPQAADPIKSLVAFKKIRLQPGEKGTVTLPFALRDCAHFDENARKWIMTAGQYKIMLGNSASDIIQSATVDLPERLSWPTTSP
ncbi:family 3 glycoside hydrolase [Xylaria telfairii]|nr:family 3 glycoside hydrolase [Xylaria telfairii]